MRGSRLALVAAMFVGRAASAQPTAFAEGKQLLQEGKPAEACLKFAAALRDQPEAPGILLNLGLCNAQQNKLATALKWFRRAQTRAAERQMTETENAAKLQTVALATSVPTIKIEVSGETPSDASVTIDGATIDYTTLARVEIDAGHHVIELHGSGLAPVSEPTDVVPDATMDTVVVTLKATAAPSKPVPIVIETDPGRPWRRWSYIVGASGVGLLLVGTGVGLAGRKIFDDAHDLDTRQRWKNIVRYGDTAIFAVGAAALGTAIGLYFAAPEKSSRVEYLTPVAGPDHVGVVIGGEF